jgi:hypothetical protein
MSWWPLSRIRKAECARLVAMSLVLLAPMSVSSCDGVLDVACTWHLVLFSAALLNSLLQALLICLLAFYVGASAHLLFFERLSRWARWPFILCQVLLILLCLTLIINWAFPESDRALTKDFFLPSFQGFWCLHAGEWWHFPYGAYLPEAFHSGNNSDAQNLDGITPFPLLALLWLTWKTYLDGRALWKRHS